MSKKEGFQGILRKILQFIVYVLLEWILIFILFIDGFLAFAANEFARFFGLKMPCLLCTRLDHVLVRRNPDFYYNDSICEAHRKDVSSLAYCHVHRRLNDVRWMCEGCLLSFATENKSNRETYRSLIGILGADLECTVGDDHKILLRLPVYSKKDQIISEKSSTHRCACCGEPLRVRSAIPHPVVQGQASNASIFPQAPTPSPRVLPPTATKMEDIKGFDQLPHIRYTELKFSDTESELPEDDNESTVKEDPKAAAVPLLPENEDSEELCKTPSYIRANRLLQFALGDSTTVTPRAHDKPFRKLLAEKAEGATEQLELSSDGDGDSIMLHLKKQVRLDRKSLIALYMELDEERSASAVAANQAMAMITRLQAEKAAMQMEALQYQRMMEEQAEYDQEAIQIMKDLLTKRDEEIKMLEAEVRSCKRRLGEDVLDIDECRDRADEDYLKLKLYSNHCPSQISDCGTPPNFYDEEGNEEDYRQNPFQTRTPRLDSFGINEESVLDQESERSYLLERLRALEQLHAASRGEALPEKASEDVTNLEEDCNGDGNAIVTREMTYLTKRLEAIENDREFLKHAFQSLQKGEEGTQLLREIAQHLRELRHVEK